MPPVRSAKIFLGAVDFISHQFHPNRARIFRSLRQVANFLLSAGTAAGNRSSVSGAARNVLHKKEFGIQHEKGLSFGMPKPVVCQGLTLAGSRNNPCKNPPWPGAE